MLENERELCLETIDLSLSTVFTENFDPKILQNNKLFDFENVEYTKDFVREFNSLISSHSLNVEELING